MSGLWWRGGCCRARRERKLSVLLKSASFMKKSAMEAESGLIYKSFLSTETITFYLIFK